MQLVLDGLVQTFPNTSPQCNEAVVFLVGLALWDAAIRERRATPAAPGPETASFASISDEQLRLATAFTAVETETDLSLGGDAADLPATDV